MRVSKKSLDTHIRKTNIFKIKANKKHNNKYDYSKSVYINAKTKIIIICTKQGHGEFEQKPHHHLQGQGCPKCSKGMSTSLPEQILFYYLSKLKLKVESRKKIDGVELDIYIPYLKLGIEYDGEYFHRNKQEKDYQKNIFFKERGIDIIRIREKNLHKVKGCFNIIRKTCKEDELEIIISNLIKYINKKYDKKYKIIINLKRNINDILETIKNNKIENSIATSHPDIAKEWHPIKNGNLKPEYFSKGSKEKVWWLCDKNHEWITNISIRCCGKKSKCPYCSGKRTNSENSLEGIYDKEVLKKFWNYEKNTIKPSEVTLNSNKNIHYYTLYGNERFSSIQSLNKTIERYLRNKPLRKPADYWTKECCHEEAMKYTSKIEFNKANRGVYSIAQKNGWLDEICSHMTVLWEKKWDFETCKTEALKYETRTEFFKNSQSSYSSAQSNGWLDEICSHMKIIKIPQEHWNNKKNCYTESLKYNSRSEFKSKCGNAYTKSRIEGWLNEFYPNKKLELINSNRKPSGYWNKEHCKEEAKKFSTRYKFQKNAIGAYQSAQKNGWLDEVCSHMIEVKKPNGYWIFEKCKEEGEKYKSRSEFKRMNPMVYQVSRENDWLDEVCSHMNKNKSI